MSLIYSVLIVLSSWAFGAILTQIIEKKPIYKILLKQVYIRSSQWNRYLGVDLFKYFVTKTIYGKINRTIKIDCRDCGKLRIAEQEMIKSEIGHLLGFLSAQLTLIVVFILKDEGVFMLIGSMFNLVLNIYPVLLQQKNRNKISRILEAYCC